MIVNIINSVLWGRDHMFLCQDIITIWNESHHVVESSSGHPISDLADVTTAIGISSAGNGWEVVDH